MFVTAVLIVAPYTGAWIEIKKVDTVEEAFDVAPYTGAWIEIQLRMKAVRSFPSRSLHGSVD